MEHLVNKENEVLLNTLANPADARNAYTLNIQSFVNEFPQSGILRALLTARGEEQNARHASVYFNPAILYKIFNAPDSLPVVTAKQIIHVDIDAQSGQFLPENLADNEIQSSAVTEAGTETNAPGETEGYVTNASTEAPSAHYPPAEAEDVKQDLAAVEFEIAGNPVVEPDVIETATADRGDNEPAGTETVEDERADYAANQEPEYFHQDIEDEIYDEIVSIEDINLAQLATINAQPVNVASDESIEEVASIPPTDHFVFDPDFAAKEEVENVPLVNAADTEEKAALTAHEKQDVSRYNDEKLPYTFMWWLDKTRKEHANVYQPYLGNSNAQPIPANTKKSEADELQHQYVESIFNLNAIEELERSTSVKNNMPVAERKEDKIINRFIQAEPQIKHPSGIKLDNENKAKKSSEDREELVTETLARIYTEQMLYQKAILAYKKLMLKFPEKSLYFASQIEQLEKKPN